MPIIDPPICVHGGLLYWCPYCTSWPPQRNPPWGTTNAPVGWQCRCGRVFNPEVRECPYCPQQKPADVKDATGGRLIPPGPFARILPVPVDDASGERPPPRPFPHSVGAAPGLCSDDGTVDDCGDGADVCRKRSCDH